jgi:hypothetical protein
VVALPALAADCATLSSAKLPDTTIKIAQSTSGGKFNPPHGSPVEKVPAFCRVAGVIRPAKHSEIRFEVWLPASGWNGKLLSTGNGGFAGSIEYAAMAQNLRRGYATAGTDTGHEADWSDGSWALHHPEKVADFGYRALHATTQNAKSLIQAFYTRLPEHSYFDSCSNGGREALMEAQRFPEDFDGILAGAPANAWTHLMTNGIDVTQMLYGQKPTGYIPSTKLPALQAAALAACDGPDGVKDGVINDPLHCHFDPSVLLCKGNESPSCLTAPQVASAKRIYEGRVDAEGKQIYPGLMPGAEDGPNSWAAWITGGGGAQGSGAIIVESFFRDMVYEDAKWNPLTAKVELIQKAADEKTARTLNATDPDLRPFQARGGKLILYHGWNDSAISPLYTVNYYESVVATMGAQAAESFLRLYMVPGMLHCSGGPGANSFGQTGNTTAKGPEYGVFDALEQWVEKDTAPGDIIATKYNGNGVQMTRPLCPFPQIAKYKGAGDSNDSANFMCTAAEESPAVANELKSKSSR